MNITGPVFSLCSERTLQQSQLRFKTGSEREGVADDENGRASTATSIGSALCHSDSHLITLQQCEDP